MRAALRVLGATAAAEKKKTGRKETVTRFLSHREKSLASAAREGKSAKVTRKVNVKMRSHFEEQNEDQRRSRLVTATIYRRRSEKRVKRDSNVNGY